MKEFENIRTELPYNESPIYVDQLVARCKDAAMEREKPAVRTVRPWYYAAASLAVAAIVALSLILWKPASTPGSLIESFLASLSDEEAAMIADWSIDDIPEYY